MGRTTPFNLKCEACLLCEKACPPRAITIESRPTLRFRRRPYFSPTSVAGYYTPRYLRIRRRLCQSAVLAARVTPVTADLEQPVDLGKADEILDRASFDAWDLTALLDELMGAYGGMPLAVASRVVERARRRYERHLRYRRPPVSSSSQRLRPRRCAAHRSGRAWPLGGNPWQVWQHQSRRAQRA